jgi:hypothetical protein
MLAAKITCGPAVAIQLVSYDVHHWIAQILRAVLAVLKKDWFLVYTIGCVILCGLTAAKYQLEQRVCWLSW